MSGTLPPPLSGHNGLKLVAGLTKEEVSYLRRADQVYAINIEGRNYLRAVKRGDPADAFSEDKRADIPVSGNGKDGYFTSAWEFPWHVLRVGDQPYLHWYPDAYTSELLRRVGLHGDTLYLDLTRGKNSPVRYLVEVGISEDNSARMCRSS